MIETVLLFRVFLVNSPISVSPFTPNSCDSVEQASKVNPGSMHV